MIKKLRLLILSHANLNNREIKIKKHIPKINHVCQYFDRFGGD